MARAGPASPGLYPGVQDLDFARWLRPLAGVPGTPPPGHTNIGIRGSLDPDIVRLASILRYLDLSEPLSGFQRIES